MLIGYARVSTRDQNLDLQLDASNGAGCEKIFHRQGERRQIRPAGLAEALPDLREGDIFAFGTPAFFRAPWGLFHPFPHRLEAATPSSRPRSAATTPVESLPRQPPVERRAMDTEALGNRRPR